jgi:membrane protein DedA with SNARE-associated domain
MSIDLTDITGTLLTAIITYGPVLLALVLFAGGVGIPLPGAILLMAGGAFIRQGVLEIHSAIPLALIGVVAGDMTSYAMGRFAGEFMQRRFGATATWQSAEATLHKRGGIAVYLTRWLLTPLAIPTNLVTGASGYPVLAFLSYDLAGEITWIALYAGLGYTFGNSFEYIAELISNFSGLLVGVVVFAAGIYLVIRLWRHPQPDTAAQLDTATVMSTPATRN